MFKLMPYTATMGLEGLRLQFAVASIATCAFWLFGYDMSIMVACLMSGPYCTQLMCSKGGLITEDSFTSVFPEMNDPSVQGIVIAALELGALVGALSCLDLGDRLGRRTTVWVGMCFMLVGGCLQCSAWQVGQLLAGRVLSGIGLGLQVRFEPFPVCNGRVTIRPGCYDSSMAVGNREASFPRQMG